MEPKRIKIFNFKLWNVTILAYIVVVILYALLSLTEIGREVEYTYNFNKWLLENFKFITITLAWFYYGYTEKGRFKEVNND